MKRILLLLILIATTGNLVAQGLNFSKAENWSSVLKQAKAENKFIFLDGTATWCKPCKLMDEQVFSSKEVGMFMNDKFICVKVQIDKTDSDDEFVKSWYNDVAILNSNYQMNVLPALIFLSSEGKLLYRNFGYQEWYKFLETAKFAVSPEASAFMKDISDYKAGKKNYVQLPKLINKMRQLMIEDSLVNIMVRDYFVNYLNKLTLKSEILTGENASLSLSNPLLVKSSDKFYTELLKTPIAQADEMMKWEGVSKALMEDMAIKEELFLKLYKDGKIKNPKPQWEAFEKRIKTKYIQLDAKKVIAKFGVIGSSLGEGGFYRQTNDWVRFNNFYAKEFEGMLQNGSYDDANNIAWWIYFVSIIDKTSLDFALKLQEKLISKAQSDSKVSAQDLSGWIDTKAALLYKLGRRNEALFVENAALQTLRLDNLKNGRKEDARCGGVLKTIELMKKGEKLGAGWGGKVVYASNWKVLD